MLLLPVIIFDSYNEFLQFNRMIQKEKVKPSVSVSLFIKKFYYSIAISNLIYFKFPANSFTQLMKGQIAQSGESKTDQRRFELEVYLRYYCIIYSLSNINIFDLDQLLKLY